MTRSSRLFPLQAYSQYKALINTPDTPLCDQTTGKCSDHLKMLIKNSRRTHSSCGSFLCISPGHCIRFIHGS